MGPKVATHDGFRWRHMVPKAVASGPSDECSGSQATVEPVPSRVDGFELTIEPERVSREAYCRSSAVQTAIDGAGKIHGCIAGTFEAVEVHFN